MKKSLNKIALVLWVLAIASAFLNSVELWSAYQNMRADREQAGEAYLFGTSMTHSISAVLVQFGFLAGLATLIEIADRISWHLRNSK
jgi:hypothetical protein